MDLAGSTFFHCDELQKAGRRIKMNKQIRMLALLTLSSSLLLVPDTLAKETKSNMEPDRESQQPLTKEVRHELIMLPYYTVFDNLSYRIDGTTVELSGQVTRPTLKSDAETVVKKSRVCPTSSMTSKCCHSRPTTTASALASIALCTQETARCSGTAWE